MELGEQCAMGHHPIRILITGISQMQELYVVNLDTKSLVCFNIMIHVLCIYIISIVQTYCKFICNIQLATCIIN